MGREEERERGGRELELELELNLGLKMGLKMEFCA